MTDKQYADPRKLRALVFYVISRHECCPQPLSRERLHTLLFIADKEHFIKHGRTITEFPWIKREWGVELDGLNDLLDQMVADGEIYWKPTRPYFSMA